MKYFVSSRGGEPLQVEVEDLPDGRCLVRVDGKEIEADFVDVDRLGQYSVRLGDQSFAASIEQHDGPTALRVSIAGRSYTFDIQDEREREASALSSARSSSAETIQAAMPGIVVGVRATAGEKVEPGQALLVLEAMKMQNEVASEQGGVVAEVLVAEGDTVSAGQALVRLEPAPDDNGSPA